MNMAHISPVSVRAFATSTNIAHARSLRSTGDRRHASLVLALDGSLIGSTIAFIRTSLVPGQSSLNSQLKFAMRGFQDFPGKQLFVSQRVHNCVRGGYFQAES